MLFRRWKSFQLPDQMDTHCLLSSAREHRLKHQDVVGPTWFIFDMSRINFDDIRTVALSLLIITNITLNVLLIVVFARYPQLREDRTAVFMFSMALSDLANGFTTMPISATLCSRVTPNVRSMTDYLPQIHAAFSAWFNVNSMHSLCWMTVYKMVAITKPPLRNCSGASNCSLDGVAMC